MTPADASDPSSDYLAPEARARMEIDDQLVACGWVVQDYPDLVNQRCDAWLHQQRALGRHFAEDQTAYFQLVKDHIAASLAIAPADLQNPPFSTHGGLGKARQLFGPAPTPFLEELTLALAA